MELVCEFICNSTGYVFVLCCASRVCMCLYRVAVLDFCDSWVFVLLSAVVANQIMCFVLLQFIGRTRGLLFLSVLWCALFPTCYVVFVLSTSVGTYVFSSVEFWGWLRTICSEQLLDRCIHKAIQSHNFRKGFPDENAHPWVQVIWIWDCPFMFVRHDGILWSSLLLKVNKPCKLVSLRELR